MASRKSFSHHSLVCLLAILISVPGCSGDSAESGGGGGAGSSVKVAKHETPEATFEAAKKAMESEDYAALVGCFTPESQDFMVFGLTMAGTMAKAFASMGESFGAEPDADAKAELEAKFAPLDKVLEKYGLTEDKLESQGLDAMQDPKAATQKIAALVDDKPAFVGEMMKALKAASDGKPQGPQQMFMAKLSDIKIDGDSASAMATVPDSPRPRPIHFAKVDGGWLIDLSKEFEGEEEPMPLEDGE
ncbi:MAG: hypothetical protein RH917_08620 [Lacipirellulaceae bacterium]